MTRILVLSLKAECFMTASKEELIVDGAASTVDITPLEGARFTENTQLSSTYGGNRA